MARRPYLRMEWIESVRTNPMRTEVQGNGRIRRWALIPEIGKYLRVVTNQMGKQCIMRSLIVASSPEI
jgi:hypothetical protein